MKKIIEELKKYMNENNPTSKYSEEEYNKKAEKTNKNNEKFWKKYNDQALELV